MSAVLEVSGVSVRFGGLQALDGVSFTVQDGGATALIGPNGAGKTTCFNVISGLQRPDAGSVRFAGRDVTRVAPHRHRGIGRTFQRVELVAGMTVRENVLLGYHRTLPGGLLRSGLGSRRRERAVRAEAAARLEEVGLAAFADRPAGTLPLGLQRLAELARAEAQGPRLLLLDEAASGLATEEMERLVERVQAARRRGCAVLLVEHNMRFVSRIVERVVVLRYGRVIFDGTLADGMRDPAVMDAYLGQEQAVA